MLLDRDWRSLFRFEQGLSGWTSQGTGVSLVTNASLAHSGNNYIHISTTGSGSVSPPTYAVEAGDQIEFGGWVYLESGTAAAVDWVLNTFDASHNLLSAVVPVPWSVTTPGVWTYETGAYTVPPGTAYITFFGQIYQASGTASARFDDGFISVGTHYLLNDQLSTRVVTDATGAVIGQQGHFPFAESWYAQNTTTNWQFASYQRDAESGNDYAMARSYVNRLARFSSPDPADLAAANPSNPQSWNRYAYAFNNPLTFTDPDGLDPCQGYNNFWFSQAADGTGIFTPQECAANNGNWGGNGGGCMLDGAQVPCNLAVFTSPGGAATSVPCPNDSCFRFGPQQGPGGSTVYQQWVPGGQVTAQFMWTTTQGPMIPGYWQTVTSYNISPIDLATFGTDGSSGALVYQQYQGTRIFQNVSDRLNVAKSFVCGTSPASRSLKSIRNGAIVGATRGAYTGFVSGEVFGGEVSLGASGLGGAAVGGLIGGGMGAMRGVFKGIVLAEACSAIAAYN